MNEELLNELRNAAFEVLLLHPASTRETWVQILMEQYPAEVTDALVTDEQNARERLIKMWGEDYTDTAGNTRSYVDLAAFDPSKIRDVGGRKMYVGRRGKTRQEYTFLLLPQALAILDRYNYQLPIMSNQKYNEYIKLLAVMAGINKPVSSHWARHTGATMLLNSGVGMEVVSKVLGHSTTRITRQIYAKLLDDTIADEMSKMLGSEKV